MSVIESVCIVLFDDNNKILQVTRSAGDGVGLPGGKVDEGETLQEAIVRELWEETGLVVQEDSLIKLYEGICSQECGDDFVRYNVTSFVSFNHSGDMEQKEKNIIPHWANFSKLITNSPFSFYNHKVGLEIKKKYPAIGKNIGL